MAAKELVERKIKTNKVVVFSKSYCPYCRKAKDALDTLIKGQYDVEELDQRPDGDAVQDVLLDITGGRSVPRVFVNEKFIGGGDDVAAKARSGELAKILGV